MIFQDQNMTLYKAMTDKELWKEILEQDAIWKKNHKSFYEEKNKNSNENKDTKYDEFKKNVHGTSTSTPSQQKTESLNCKNYCFLWKLLSEVTILKLEIEMKNELLSQQLQIIKVLATKVFTMENLIKRTGKTPEQILQPDMASEKELENHEMSQEPSKNMEPTSTEYKDTPQTICENPLCGGMKAQHEIDTQGTKRSSIKSTEFTTPEVFIKKPEEEDSLASSRIQEEQAYNKHRKTSERSIKSGRITNKDSGGTDKKSVVLILGSDGNNSVVVEPEKDLSLRADEVTEVPHLDNALVVGTRDSLEFFKSSTSEPNEADGLSLSSSEELIVVENMLQIKTSGTAPSSGKISNKESGLDKKSVHLVIDDGSQHATIVEPQKDRHPPEEIKKPKLESVPVIGTTDSLELVRKKSSTKKNIICVCNDSGIEYEKLREENEKLRNGEEIKRLTSDVEEKVRRILELNEENRVLNDMVNQLKHNKHSASDPISTDSEDSCACRKRRRRDSQMKKCVCFRDDENKPQGFIDVYKIEDKRKFITDSSSTVCNEDICGAHNSPTSFNQRARAGNDFNTPPCPAETFRNYEYQQLMEECFDTNCPNKDAPYGSPFETRFIVGFTELCSNQQCQTEGCEMCFGMLEPDVVGENSIALTEEASCTDQTCPNKDYYPPTTLTASTAPTAAQAAVVPKQEHETDFPISCIDTTCPSTTCPMRQDICEGLSLQQGSVSSFPITCNDTTCQNPTCGAEEQLQIFDQLPSIAEQDNTTLQSEKPQPQVSSAVASQISSPVENQPAPISSVCVCVEPTQCQDETESAQIPAPPIISIFNGPANVSSTFGTGPAGPCPRGVCETCVCIQFPTQRPSSAQPFVPSYHKPQPGTCIRGICETCACMVFPGMAGSQRPATAPVASIQEPARFPPSSGMKDQELCKICGCPLSATEIPAGQIDEGTVVKPNTMDATTTSQAIPEALEIASTSPGSAIHEAPKVQCVCAGQEILIKSEELGGVDISKPQTGATSAITPSAPPADTPCPDDLCGVCCTCEVEPSLGDFEDSDVDVGKEKPKPITGGMGSVKPSVTISEQVSVKPIEPSEGIKEEASHLSEMPSNVQDGSDKNPCICEPEASDAQRPPDIVSEKAPQSLKGAENGTQIIRCMCKSKYCKIVPDPDNPNLKLCVDASEFDLRHDEEGTCVCAPPCPNADDAEGSEKPSSPDCPANFDNQTMDRDILQEGSLHAKQIPVFTVASLKTKSTWNRGDSIPTSPYSAKSLSKEQEYAGLSRKEFEGKKTNYFPPKKSTKSYGNLDSEPDDEENNAADLKLVIADLKSKLLDAEDKIEELKSKNTYASKDNDSVIISRYSEEIEALKKSLKWSTKEKEEYELLKEKVKSLEQGRGDTESVTVNLQTAVNLYANTVEIMEHSQERLKLEVEQYKTINTTIRDALASLLSETEEIRKKYQTDMEEQLWLNFVLNIDNNDIQHTNSIYEKQINKQHKLYQCLMELNYNLELEHVNTLQDLSMLEVIFYKYQHFLKIQEDDNVVMKSQLKKLSKKNKCYEEVVKFFKQEMSVMSDELFTLQEVLNVTNVSSLEESNKLINAILQLRRINDGLVSHLCAIEKQVVLENQINQINEARINELQQIIGEKNNDLNQHDEIIHDMRKKLSNSNKQNADLKKTIKNLTDTVVEIQEGIKTIEMESHRNKGDAAASESSTCLVNGDLAQIKLCMEQKNEKILNLENRLKDQEVSLILANKELKMLKEKKFEYNQSINSLKEQLSISEKKNMKVIEDYHVVVKQLSDYTSFSHMKNFEVKHYKSLIEEMKMSLMQLNNGLEKCEATNIHFYEDLENFEQMQSISKHKKGKFSMMFDELKRSMADLKNRLSEADIKGGLIEEEIVKVKESHMSLIEEDITEDQRDLAARIMSSVEEQTRLNLLINAQKTEIERLKQELSEREKEQKDCSCKRSVSDLKNEKMACNAQMEISQLKSDLNKSLQRQRMLNEENDKIHTQMINLRKKLTMMEHAYEVLKQENEEGKMQLKKALREKEYTAYKNQELTENIEQLKTCQENLEKQCRYNSDCVRNLELELSEVQTEKANLSTEAENLMRVVKAWLEEQNVVNGKIRGKFQIHHEAINSMKEMLLKRSPEHQSWEKIPVEQVLSARRFATASQPHRRAASPGRSKKSSRYSPERRHRHSNPWRNDTNYDDYPTNDLFNQKHKKSSYGSYSSPYSSRTPSPRSNSVLETGEEAEVEVDLDDWFSPNYRETETDLDEGDEDTFINKLEIMTYQVQEANKRWQQKMGKDHVSRPRVTK